MNKSHIEGRLYPFRFRMLLIMLGAVAMNLLSLAGDVEVLLASFLGHVLFGQAVFSYLSGWRISIGPGIVGNTSYKYGRDCMGLFVALGFLVMFFFRGY